MGDAPVMALADTMMTRSIGDWDSSRQCIPEPQLMHFTVKRGEHMRVVIASDGVWDFFTSAKAAVLARRCKKPIDAAYKLVERSNQRSHQKLGMLKDDTTCVVVDLDLSEPGTTTQGAGGCCAVQ